MDSIRSLAGLLKPGDYAVFLLALLLILSLSLYAWQSPAGQNLIVRAKGRVVAELPLHTPRILLIQGAMGNSMIEIASGRARVIADPGPRQLCVKQGWISRTGDTLLCLANQVTLEITGQISGYDSLSY